MAPTVEDELAHATHVEPGTLAIEHRNRLDKPEDVQMVADAQAATAKEHQMTLWQGIKLYPKAIGWSLLFSSVIIMEGYDVVLMGSFYAYPTFCEKYGELQPDGSYQLPGAVSLSPELSVCSRTDFSYSGKPASPTQ
jgi:MFS transporter, SP family, general alpha glucoside:H+ symporter